MNRFIQLVFLLAVALLSGCGEVVVFGHVVREGKQTATVSESAPPTVSQTAISNSSSSSSSSSSPSKTSETATPSIPATPAVTATQPKSPLAPTSNTDSKKETVQTPPIHLIKAITLSMTPEVTALLSKDHRLSTKDLLDALKSELQTRKLLDPDSSSVTLVVYIDHYELRANTNFVIFDSTPHTGTLAGNLLLRDSQDNDTPLSHIETYSRIAVPESGETPELLQPLYKQFAVTVANALLAPARHE